MCIRKKCECFQYGVAPHPTRSTSDGAHTTRTPRNYKVYTYNININTNTHASVHTGIDAICLLLLPLPLVRPISGGRLAGRCVFVCACVACGFFALHRRWGAFWRGWFLAGGGAAELHTHTHSSSSSSSFIPMWSCSYRASALNSMAYKLFSRPLPRHARARAHCEKRKVVLLEMRVLLHCCCCCYKSHICAGVWVQWAGDISLNLCKAFRLFPCIYMYSLLILFS